MKKKKLYGVASALLASSIALAGCSFGAGSDSGSDEGSGDQVTVDIFQFKVEFKDQFEALTKKYEEENPNVNINVKTVGGGNDYGSSLKTSFSSGEEPDIFNIGGPSDVETYEKYLADMSDTEAAKAALEGTLTSVNKNDETLGLPFNQEGYGILYNKKIFEEAGINPDDIKTHEDLVKATEKLDSKKEDLGIQAPFALPAKETWVIGNHLANTFLADEFNHDVMEAYQADTVEFAMGDQMKRFLDLQNEYSVQPTLSLDYSQQVEELFSLGEVAMIQQGNWVYNTILQMDEEMAKNNVGLLPIPVEGYEGSIPVGVPMYWAVNKQSEDEVVKESKEFLDWMYTSEEGKKFVTEEFKFIPAYEGYEDQKIADPISKEIYEYAAAGDTLGWVFLGAPTNWTEGSLAVNMQQYLSGDITWEQVEENARKDWENSRQ
ncbi:raffinose/stachyose/melibiose transport system substrate-binding protein [Thalassobacillus cyri]|uniref:Raffinose/stachyose/melibiose transport system substrate-binding protein n=1 Tax=Thalassobacillus cyri TaxID=571932 RepID=A0A1H4ALM0_9BACI|nr:ABC transporter substrate-binding protein [Thalassobacillus cyri]SEA36678.1 raffinose/stachyose/melibiose transport system substrate-binding protein [Thalassobacillus cyri]